MSKQNIEKDPPKGNVKFSITLSEEQKKAKSNILDHSFNFIIGKAGSGKTLLACQIALDMFVKRKVNRIIITRPTVSTEDNGFLPGTEKEKLEPWLVPIMSNMQKVYNKQGYFEKLEKERSLELVSLTHFRGRTFDDAIVIIDEFQNLTRSQLSMAIGRLGKNSKMIFCGDLQQIDLKDKNYSAIHEVAKLLESKYVYRIMLQDNHRHPGVDELLNLLNSYN